MSEERKKLLIDIEKLLNSYDGERQTHLSTTILEFMDEDALKAVIGDLLNQKERVNEDNREWLEQFKKK